MADTINAKPLRNEIGQANVGIIPWTGISDGSEDVPELAWPNSVRTYSKIRTDGQVASLLRGVTLPIRRFRWFIDPNGARDEIVQHVATDLGLPINGDNDPGPQPRQRDRFVWDTHLRHVLLKLVWGHMFFEQNVRIVNDQPGGTHLRKLAPRMPATIQEINAAPDGGLEWIKQFGTGNPTPGGGPWGSGASPPIPVNRLVAHINDQEGGNWFGYSMLRPTYKHWLLKDRLLRVDALKHERNGMGVPTIEAQQGATTRQMAELNAMAQRYKSGEMSGGALPYGAKLRLVGVEGALPDTLASIKYQDEQMARIFLEMFMQLGTTSHGTRNLGSTFLDFFSMSLEAVASDIALVTTSHVVEDIVDWNWGIDEGAPRVGFEAQDDKSLIVDDLVSLIDSGAIVVDEDTERWVRERYEMPPIAPDRPEPAPPVVVAPIPPAVPPTPTPATARGNPARVRGKGFLRRWRTRAASSKTLPTRPLWREPNEHEVRAGTNFKTIEADWTTNTADLIAAWKADVAPNLQQSLYDAIEALVDAGDIAGLGALTLPAGMGIDTLVEHMTAAAIAGVDQAHAEAASQGVAIVKPEAPADRLAGRAAAIDGIMSRSLADVGSRVALLHTGDTATGAEVAQAVRDHIEGLSDTYLNDMLGNAVTTATNDGRTEVMSQAPATFYASELLDESTCDECEAIDGTEYGSLDEADADYPAGGYGDCAGGPRCRGTLVAVYEEGTTSADEAA